VMDVPSQSEKRGVPRFVTRCRVSDDSGDTSRCTAELRRRRSQTRVYVASYCVVRPTSCDRRRSTELNIIIVVVSAARPHPTNLTRPVRLGPRRRYVAPPRRTGIRPVADRRLPVPVCRIRYAGPRPQRRYSHVVVVLPELPVNASAGRQLRPVLWFYSVCCSYYAVSP